MTIRLRDRLGGLRDAVDEAAVLGRFMVSDDASSDVFINSFPALDGMFLVPESNGRSHLSRSSERIVSSFPRAQMLDSLDAGSVRSVGHSLSELIDKGGTWLDALDLSPLVPGMSSRVEIQRFEQLLKENIGHIEEVCHRPRTHLRVDVERMAVSRARRFPVQAASYLASHTEDWERPTLRSVVPSRILATVREDQFDIYENRVAVRLVDQLIVYLRRRVHEVTRLLRVFEEASGNHGAAASGSHWRQGRIYKLWASTLDTTDGKRKPERTLRQLKHLLFTISGLKDSLLYREVPRRASIGTTLAMTNILTDDVHYRRVANLWLAWARLGQDGVASPRAYFEQMQDLCRSFDGFTLLLTLRALDQLGFEPTDYARSLSDREADVSRGAQRASLSWTSNDGAISIRATGGGALRIVPICSSLALLGDEQIRALIADADARATAGSTTVVVFPSPSEPTAFERLAPDIAARLRSLAHEVGREQHRVSFVPVSPWDIGSVERIARQLRWITTAPMFRAYPPRIAPLSDGEPTRMTGISDSSGNMSRALSRDDAMAAKRLADDAATRLARLEDEHRTVSAELREAVRHGAATAGLNAQKKDLNAKIVAAERTLEAVRRFERDVERAVEIVEELLTCPTCNTRADARRDFTPMGQYFWCTCGGCSTSWGTIACGGCSKSIPVLRLNGTAWATAGGEPGWIDRTFGADVLAVPRVVGADIGFVCPSCGDCRVAVQ